MEWRKILSTFNVKCNFTKEREKSQRNYKDTLKKCTLTRRRRKKRKKIEVNISNLQWREELQKSQLTQVRKCSYKRYNQ